MRVNNSKERRNKIIKKILKIGAISIFSIFLIFEISHSMWKESGSNDWKLVKEEDQIKIWTLKTPGSSLIKVKANTRIKSSLASIVSFLEDEGTLEENLGITEKKVFEKKDSPSGYMAYVSYMHEMPLPIGAREFVILMHHSQDPATKKVEINVLAAPNKTPPKENVVRFTHLNNIWQLTPLSNGEVDIVFLVDMDIGGNLPYFIKNAILPEAFYQMFKEMPSYLKRERYKNAKVNFIEEFLDSI